MGCPELEVTEQSEALCIRQGAAPASHGIANTTAERIVPSPAFKENPLGTYGYSSAAVAMGNLARSCLSKSILLGRPSYHTPVLEGKAESRNGGSLSTSARPLTA